MSAVAWDRQQPDVAPSEHVSTTAQHLHTAWERPTDAGKNLGPNWFAAVMGTGIVAIAAISLPRHVPGQRPFALAVWVGAAVLLVLLSVATGVHWLRHPANARSHLSDPVMCHFYGAPPMALLTVGTGALVVGKDLIGTRAAVDLDWMLWTAGTVTGLLTALLIPYTAFTRHRSAGTNAFGGWLMPVVPPMVSASAGALLVPYAAAGQARETLLLGCYVMFGLSLFASLIIITQIWTRLAHHDIGPAAAVPTLWIVLGPLGQSITAVNLLGTAAGSVLVAPYPAGAAAFGLLYGVATWGFAVLWFAVAAAITIRTARRLPFSLAWWSFTFPVGTVVTGTSTLAERTGLDAFVWGAVALYIFLLGAWGTVFVRTARGALNGWLLVPTAALPVGAPPVAAPSEA